MNTIEIERLAISRLAGMAGCSEPDEGSPGADFLETVRAEALSLIDTHATFDLEELSFEIATLADAVSYVDIADAWLQALDLRAWEEDVSAFFGVPGCGEDLEDLVFGALRQIATRLITTLVTPQLPGIAYSAGGYGLCCPADAARQIVSGRLCESDLVEIDSYDLRTLAADGRPTACSGCGERLT